MALLFDPEFDEYAGRRDAILTEFERWARRRSDIEAGWGQDACVFLDWRVGYSSGDLAAFTVGDIEEYLLEWCPRKLSFAPEHWLGIVEGVEAWLLHVVETGQWTGGLVQPLLAALTRLTPQFLDEMANPANFGMAKGLFAGPALAGADLDFTDPEEIQAAIAAFNSLPFDERKTATDPGLASMIGAPSFQVELPMTPSADHDLAASAAAEAPIVIQARAAVDFLGSGRALTAKGNPKLADARALLDIFATDDVADVTVERYQRTLRSADDLPHLMYLLDVAREAGALRRHGGKLVGVKAFANRTPLDQVEALFTAMIELGPIFGRGVTRYHANEAALIEDGLFHWMVPVFVDGAHHVDEIIDQAIEVVSRDMPSRFTGDPELERGSLVRQVEKVLDVMERCGLVTRSDTLDESDRFTGRARRRGGVLHLTELGRLLLPPRLASVGYGVRDAGSITDISADDLLELFGSGAALEPAEVWAAWNPHTSAANKAAAIVTALQTAESPYTRLAGLALLHEAPNDAPVAVRALLDTPLAGHATMLLLDLDAISVDDAGSIDPASAFGPLVDMLAVELDTDPDQFAVRFDAIIDQDVLDALGVLWRVDLPETLEVLDALGQRHPDKHIAKAARKAAIQHRSRYRR